MKKSLKVRINRVFMSCIILLASAQSFAHAPYLLPNIFDIPENGVVSIDATMGEYFFIPDRAFTGSEFTVDLPNGNVESPETLIELKARTVVEHTMRMPGTYRFSTGWRGGNIVKSYELDGRTRRLQGVDSVIPEGGKLLEIYRSSTMAEAYVTQGAPNQSALKPKGKGLEFEMLSHPNKLFSGEEVNIKALLDGSPVADVAVDVYLAARQEQGSVGTYTLKSSQHGELMFTPEKAGIYILKSRHTVQSAMGKQEPSSRYTYTLVFEVTE